MSRSPRRAMALVLLALAAPAAARVIDYTATDATMLTDAAELKIAPVAALPAHGGSDVAVELGGAVDHVTLALGMYCSAYKVENRIGALVRQVAAAWDRDGVLDPAGDATLLLRVTAARSMRRCFEVGEMNVRCVTRVTLSGMVENKAPDGGVRSVPIAADVERDASVGGFCGSLARGIAVVSREAAIALVADAQRKLAPPPA